MPLSFFGLCKKTKGLFTKAYEMRFLVSISVGIKALLINKLRSLLTTLGIIIGIASVLAMIAIGDGAKEIILEDIQKLGGLNTFTLYRVSTKLVGGRRVPIRSNEHFNYSDVLAIEAACSSVKGVTLRLPSYSVVLVQAKEGSNMRAGYYGVNEVYTELMKWDLQAGRFISTDDVNKATKVAVIGTAVATNLFGNASPIGKEIKIGSASRQYKYKRRTERFIVIGTLAPRGRSLKFGMNYDEQIFIPVTTMQQRFTGNDRILQIVVHASTVEAVPKSIEEVKAVIRKRHRNEDDFFRIFEVHSGTSSLLKISTIIKIALGSIAGFSLLLGGIGIMNMMLVAVGERTREIGLCKALGAKNSDILLQFLSESVSLCSIGGLLGVGLGVFVGNGMAYLAVRIVKIVPTWPAVFSLQWILISVAFSAVLGICFGLYPAVKAMRLSPIEALRAE